MPKLYHKTVGSSVQKVPTHQVQDLYKLLPANEAMWSCVNFETERRLQGLRRSRNEKEGVKLESTKIQHLQNVNTVLNSNKDSEVLKPYPVQKNK